MFELIITGIISGTVGYFIAKRLNDANFNIYLEQAKAKANVIESEAKITLDKLQGEKRKTKGKL